MTLDQIHTWLVTVGNPYHVHKAYHRQMRGLLPPHRHFIYNIISKTPYKGEPLYSVEGDGYDATETVETTYTSIVSINAYAENGYEVLAALDASRKMTAINTDIFTDCVSVRGITGDILDLTLIDETEENPRWRFQADFEFIEWETYSLTREDHIWDEYEITGTTTDDNGNTVDVVITNK